jgi:MFS family permease
MATAIPKITDQFGSLDDVGWYGSAYLLTNCSVSLLYGKLYTFFSIKWVYLVALGLFELGSLVCGITPNSIGLILGRAVAGIGAGGIFPGTILIIAESVPMRQRPIFTALISAIYSVSGVAGPIIGGALTDHATWRWCFYINLPLGGVTCLFVLAFYHAQSPMKTRNGLKDVLMQLDPIGLLCFLPSMISLLLALQWGGTRYPWSSTQVIVLFVVFGVLLVAFVAVQWWQQDRATISPQLIMNRNVWGASIFVFCLAASLMEYTYYVSRT